MNRNLITSHINGILRNDWDDPVGMWFVVGDTPIRVTQLGRWINEGNEETHLLHLQNSDGDDLGTVEIDADGAPADAFLYGTLTTPVVLEAGRTYFLVSKENSGGDEFLQYDTVIGVSGFIRNPNPIWWSGATFVTENSPGRTYVLVDLVFDVPILDNYPTPEFGGPWILKLTDLEDQYLVTQSERFKDGKVDSNLDAPDPVKRFQLLYDGLDALQAEILDQHFRAAKGVYEFNFKHPRSGIVYTAQYEEGRDPDHTKTWIQSRSVKLIHRP